MPPRTRKSRKPPPPPRELTEEEQQRRDQCDLLLNDFDKQVEALEAEAAREKKATCDAIDMVFKLDLMKLPADTKSMNWEKYCVQVRPLLFVRYVSSLKFSEHFPDRLSPSKAWPPAWGRATPWRACWRTR